MADNNNNRYPLPTSQAPSPHIQTPNTYISSRYANSWEGKHKHAVAHKTQVAFSDQCRKRLVSFLHIQLIDEGWGVQQQQQQQLRGWKPVEPLQHLFLWSLLPHVTMKTLIFQQVAPQLNLWRSCPTAAAHLYTGRWQNACGRHVCTSSAGYYAFRNESRIYDRTQPLGLIWLFGKNCDWVRLEKLLRCHGCITTSF